jgi:hypothetical protein
MRGNKIFERLTVKDSNTSHSLDYRYIGNQDKIISQSRITKNWHTQAAQLEVAPQNWTVV